MDNFTNAIGKIEQRQRENMEGPKAGEFREWRLQQELPVDFNVREAGLDRRIQLQSTEKGSLLVEFSAFDALLISISNFNLSEKSICTLSGVGPTIGLYFHLSGRCFCNGSGSAVTIEPGQQTIYYSSGYHEQLHLTPEKNQVQSLEINLPIEYYTSLVSGYSVLQEQFINQITKDPAAALHLGILPMTMPMKWIINTIKQCARTGILKRIFLEAKILELLMLQVEHAGQPENNHNRNFLRSSEIEALYEAKNILERSLDNPPTIRNLSKMIGMNEFNLKKGFKDTFNTTVYGYVNQLKMRQAKQLLLDGDKTINEVSILTGYKNPQHFTVAFKKYFGGLPSKLKSS